MTNTPHVPSTRTKKGALMNDKYVRMCKNKLLYIISIGVQCGGTVCICFYLFVYLFSFVFICLCICFYFFLCVFICNTKNVLGGILLDYFFYFFYFFYLQY